MFMKKLIISEGVLQSLYGKGNHQTAHEVDGENYLVKKPIHFPFYTPNQIKDYELMQKHSAIFAKIYKIEKDEIWQEKLDDKGFRKDLLKLSLIFKQKYFTPHENLNTQEGLMDSVMFAFQQNRQDDDFKKLLVGLDGENFKFAKKLLTIIQNLDTMEDLFSRVFDTNRGNFGYDEYENIKMFDI